MVDIVKPDIESLTSDFSNYGRIRENYEGSEEQQLDFVTENHEDEVAPLAEAELEKQNENNNNDNKRKT